MGIKKRFNLQGHAAFVTGSSDGIGKAIALGLAEFGADVMVHAKDEEAQCQEVVDQIRERGVKSDFVLADLADHRHLPHVFTEVTRRIVPDIIVLNASVQIRKPFMEIVRDDYDLQSSVNFWSTMRLIQLFCPAMRNNGWGRIITLGSVQQLKPHREMAVYAATKSAVMTLVQNLAIQFGSEGITVNNLSPGVVKTGRNKEALADK